MTTLYGYFRSSASYRVRIALNLKGQAYDTVPVHLLNQGGEQFLPAFAELNPHSLVPVLAHDGHHLAQSLAVLEYLEERFPMPSLLPGDFVQRARIRELSLAIACEIHPLNNLRVLRYLKHTLGVDEEKKNAWIQHWIKLGFTALEKQLAADAARGHFCVGDMPTMADCCLVPQIFNARRFEVDMAPYPTLCAIEDACNALPAFQAAHPAQQPDAA
ncbi:maleylacetoacetate isomerase [Herbaspirillum robiniae]|uniref:Maleylacetoacetate isomerase n=1 Tax=Herbaspirillum robiniae TaxID=2014887 RepID=A0A246WRT3_9BURK|nr:maleylacetoacetate isomerase [Herbaspirillum robiniae]NUU03368.1 maleylacetoacetate isomerase [Herbaspirillum robiniae]OWY29135.1 maleylacetoacetate isomerase [Herbaspirillum robiniae]